MARLKRFQAISTLPDQKSGKATFETSKGEFTFLLESYEDACSLEKIMNAEFEEGKASIVMFMKGKLNVALKECNEAIQRCLE